MYNFLFYTIFGDDTKKIVTVQQTIYIHTYKWQWQQQMRRITSMKIKGPSLMHFDSGALYQRSRESENQVELNFTLRIINVDYVSEDQ